MLLHYMEINEDSIMVSRTCSIACEKCLLSEKLGLSIAKSRFFGMTDNRIGGMKKSGFKILIDDADYILKSSPREYYEIFGLADIITVTEK